MHVKQVLIANMAVPMGIGRLAAQMAHASIAVFLDMGEWVDHDVFEIGNISSDMQYWMKESFTKIACKAWGKTALYDLEQEAIDADIPCALITDDGHVTALAIGPAESYRIDMITGGLPLL